MLLTGTERIFCYFEDLSHQIFLIETFSIASTLNDCPLQSSGAADVCRGSHPLDAAGWL